MEEYIAAKRRILKHAQRVVLNWGDEITRKLGESVTVPVTYFSKNPIDRAALRPCDSAITIENGCIIGYWANEEREEILPLADIRLPGLHNAEKKKRSENK